MTRPADPTGVVVPLADVAALAGEHWLILDEALAGFLPDGEDALVEHPRVMHVRSFSKAHAMAGFRIGYAVLPEGVELPLAPVLGVSAPAQAGALWAVEHGAESARRRRAQAATERSRLEAALADTPFHPSPGHGPYVWLAAPSGPELAEALAARRIYVAPGTAWGDEHHVRVTLRDAAATDRLVGGANRPRRCPRRPAAPPRPRSPARPARRSRRARAGASAARHRGRRLEQSRHTPATSTTTIRPSSRQPQRPSSRSASIAHTPTSVSSVATVSASASNPRER